MQIQLNTDDNVQGREELAVRVRADVENALSRFRDQLTRVEVHLGDENAGKTGGADKRCTMEGRLAGQQPVAVTHNAATLAEAWNGAAQKLKNLLESRLGARKDHKGAPSIRDLGPV
jgi:hypothetical protein